MPPPIGGYFSLITLPLSLPTCAFPVQITWYLLGIYLVSMGMILSMEMPLEVHYQVADLRLKSKSSDSQSFQCAGFSVTFLPHHLMGLYEGIE